MGPFERFVLGGDGLTGQNFILGTDVIGLRGYPNPQQSARRATSLTPFDSEANILGGIAFTKYISGVEIPGFFESNGDHLFIDFCRRRQCLEQLGGLQSLQAL